MSKLKTDAETKLEKFINDVTKLQVTTLSGNLTIDKLAFTDGNEKKIDFREFIDKLVGDITEASKFEVVATTNVDFDKDVVQFVKANLSDEEIELLEFHRKSVVNSTEARRAAIESLFSIFKGIGKG